MIKKFLTSMVLCLMAVIGVFSLFGCEKNRDMTGVYKLSFAIYSEGDSIQVYNLDENPEFEYYIQIQGTTVTEYKVFPTEPMKTLYNMEKMVNLTLPEFQITKEDGIEYFHNYTNLNRYEQGANQSKIERWTYVKVEKLPNLVQNSLIQYFGEYSLSEKWVGGDRQPNEDIKLVLNGNIKLISGEDTAEYIFEGKDSSGAYVYKKDDLTIYLTMNGNKVKTYTNPATINSDYNLFEIIVED